MKKNNGFTVIELLGVIVILGVISLIAIGSYTMYVNKSKNTAYDAAEKSMIEATNGVFTDCMINMGNSFLCTLYNAPKNGESRIVYVEDLIQGQYLNKIKDPEQQGEFCDSLKSYVFVSGGDKKESDNTNLKYKSCLYCSNYKSQNCDFDLVAGKDFGVKIQMRLNDNAGSDYNSEFTKDNVWINVTSLDPYQFGIKKIEYATNVSGPWIGIVDGTMTWGNEGITKLMFRVTDNANNISDIASTYIKIDRVAPTASFDIKGIIGRNNWYTSNVTIGAKDQDDGEGSGVASAMVDISSINADTQSTVVTLTVADILGNIRSYQQVIKIDKVAPACLSSGSSETWSNANLIINGTCSDQTSGCVGNINKTYTDNINSMIESPGAVSDNAGNTTSCPANQIVRIDKTNPTASVSFQSAYPAPVTITANDALSGLNSTAYSFDGGVSWQSSNQKLFYTNQNVIVKVRDNAGNIYTHIPIYVTVYQTLASQAKIGDFVNYDAGNWGYTSYGNWVGHANNSYGVPTHVFGGFYAGSSRNSGKNCAYGSRVTNGWQLFSKSGNTVTLISAGTPMCYTHPADGGSSKSSTDIANFYYQQFINTNYATSATWLNKARVESYLGVGYQSPGYQIWNPLIHNGAFYWLGDYYDYRVIWEVDPNNGYSTFNYSRDRSFGIRVMVTLKDGVLTSGHNGWSWNILPK